MSKQNGKKNSLTKELNVPYERKFINEPEPEIQVQNLNIASIFPDPDNPRKTYSKEVIKELAESMHPPTGLLHPITVRPKADKFEIVFGEKRFKAATLLKWVTIPALVKNYTDDQMLEIQLIEVLQREDLAPLDEAHAFKDLLKNQNLDWLAARIHKTKKYISDRLKLNDLVKEAADYLAKGILPLGHSVVISKLPYADQKACLDKCIDNGYGKVADYCKMALEDLKEFIADDIMLEFTRASFDTDDPDLYPAAGACKVCPKRTSNSNLLFNDITSADRCTDPACFNEKIKLNIERAKVKGKEQYGKVLSGEKNSYSNVQEIKVQGITVPIQKVPNKNSIPVVITKVNSLSGKKEIGTTVYVDKNKVDLVKHEKEEKKAEKKSTPKETYEQRELRELKENWPRIDFIVKTRAVIPSVIKEFLREALDEIEGKVLFSFAGQAILIPEISTAELAISLDEDYSKDYFKKKTEIIDKVINNYTLEELIMIIMMLKSFDDSDERKLDHSHQFGFTWNELVQQIHPKADKKSVKNLTEKIK